MDINTPEEDIAMIETLVRNFPDNPHEQCRRGCPGIQNQCMYLASIFKLITKAAVEEFQQNKSKEGPS